DAELEFGAVLKAKQQSQQYPARWGDLPGDRRVEAGDEFRRAGFAVHRRSSLPRVPIGPPRPVGELLRDRVEPLKPDAHFVPSLSSNYRDRSLASRRAW